MKTWVIRGTVSRPGPALSPETCPVYLGHGPSPNWRPDPRHVPPPQWLARGQVGARMIEDWGYPCRPGVVPHTVNPVPAAPPSRGSRGGVNIWKSRHRGIERGCEMQQCLPRSQPAPPSCQRPEAAGTPARAGISNTTVVPQTV